MCECRIVERGFRDPGFGDSGSESNLSQRRFIKRVESSRVVATGRRPRQMLMRWTELDCDIVEKRHSRQVGGAPYLIGLDLYDGHPFFVASHGHGEDACDVWNRRREKAVEAGGHKGYEGRLPLERSYQAGHGRDNSRQHRNILALYYNLALEEQCSDERYDVWGG